MRALDMALSHINHRTTYSWDLTTLISLGVPVSYRLRQRLVEGSITQEDADALRVLLLEKKKLRIN